MAVKEKTEKDILMEISRKLDYLILTSTIKGKDESEKIKILKSLHGALELGKREIERITGVDRRKF